jgi:hypothetical protein
VAAGLDVLTGLVEAAYTTHKAPLLQHVTRRINTLRYLLRLAKDLKLLKMDSFAFAADRLEEVGRMTSGWLRSQERRP